MRPGSGQCPRRMPLTALSPVLSCSRYTSRRLFCNRKGVYGTYQSIRQRLIDGLIRSSLKGGSIMFLWKTLAPMVAGLGLCLTLPAVAQDKSQMVRCPANDLVARTTVVLKGVLRHDKGDKAGNPLLSHDYWTVRTSDR